MLMLISRGHVDDQIEPEWLAPGNTINFIRDVLNLDPFDVIRRFEQWSCSKELGMMGFIKAS